MSRTLQWGTLGITFVLIFGVWLVTKNAAELQQEIYSKLESKFGFISAAVSIKIEDQRLELFKIDPVDGGLISEAGFQKGDIIVSHSKPAFYALLYEKKGKTEAIEILRGNMDSSFNNDDLTTISFSIPN